MKTFFLQDDATIDYDEHFLSTKTADQLFEELLELNYEQPIITMWDKEVPIPRLQSWMAAADVDRERVALYQKQPPVEWSPSVRKIRKELEKLYDTQFDYVLINYYPNGKSYINYHTDGEQDDGSPIASISLGGTRRFLLKNIADPSLKREFQLVHGSLIVMRDTMQKTWKHSIPKTAKQVEPRINLTFRTII